MSAVGTQNAARQRLRSAGSLSGPVLAMCSLLFAAAADAAEPSLASQVKAACIVNFVRFVDWPEDAFRSASDPIVIGILGGDPYQGAMESTATDKEIHGRKLIVKRLQNTDLAKGVHVLIIGNVGREECAATVAKLRASPVLTISDAGDFMKCGGAVRFFESEGKVRFEINPEAAKRSKLRVSSKLLKLAAIYRVENTDSSASETKE